MQLCSLLLKFIDLPNQLVVVFMSPARLTANPGQVVSPDQPFSTQTPVTVYL